MVYGFVERILASLPKQEIAPSRQTDTSEETKPTQDTQLTKTTDDTKWTKPTRNTDVGVKST